MAEVLDPDICVIGAGSAGLSVAAGAAQFGLSVVLVEKGLMGGDCLNYGCVPSKALIAAASRAHMVGEAAAFGVHAELAKIDFAEVNRHVKRVIETIAPNDSADRFTGLGVRVIRGAARFVSPREIEADGIKVAARRFVIATGSKPLIPPIPGLSDTPHFTNETIFDITDRPEHLLVLGAGPIGLELAQAHRRLGARVTVLEAQAPMAREDRELAGVVLGKLRREGVDIRSGVRVSEVEHRAGSFVLHLESETGAEHITGSHLLVATGRSPAVAGLGLEDAGISHSQQGIVVNSALRTSNRRVFAIGDVAGRQQFTHVANYHAGLVLRSIMTRWPHRASDAAVPRVTYTDPEIAWVGQSEEQAIAGRRDVRIQRWPLAENDRAQAEHLTAGLIKVITTKRGRVLGAGIAGAHAGELIVPWCMAITQGMNIKAMTQIIVPYPTLSEISKRAAYAYYAPILLKSSLPGLVRWLVRAF